MDTETWNGAADVEDADDDLFGDEAVDQVPRRASTEASAITDDQDEDGITAEERARRRALEYEEDEGPAPENIHRVIHELSIPNQGNLRSSDGNFWLIKLPSYAKYDSRPFDADTFQATVPEDEKNVESALAMKMELINTLRWRWVRDADGSYRRQSNSRIIKWNDGSLSLQLGQELYDISLNVDTAGGIEKGSIHGVGASQGLPGASASSSQQSHTASVTSHIKPNGLTFIAAQHPEASILQTEARVAGIMGLRPAGVQAKLHSQFRKAVNDKYGKHAKVKYAREEELAAVEKEFSENAKRRPGKMARTQSGEGSYRRRRISAYGSKGDGLTPRKRKTTSAMYSDEEEAEYSDADDDTGGPAHGYGTRRGTAGKGDSKAGTGDYVADEFLIADSDEEDGYGGGSGRKRKTRAEQEEADAEMDDLDILDAQIERNQRSSRLPQEEAEEEDEDEEGNAVRKTSSRRRPAPMITDSDED